VRRAATSAQSCQALAQDALRHAVCRDAPDVAVLGHCDPTGLTQRVAAEAAREHRHVVQIPAFLIAAYGPFLDTAQDREAERLSDQRARQQH
jgi:hypothetical protein